MYDRAPRLLSLAALGSTEEHVGPGSYQVSFPKRQATGGCAPFLSSAARQSAFTGFSHPDEVVPGPADYDVSEAQEVPIATLKYRGVHFGNTSGRRELPPKLGPGPGHYDITQKKKLYCENINIKKDQQKNCYSSFIPRFYEIIALQEEKKGTFFFSVLIL